MRQGGKPKDAVRRKPLRLALLSGLKGPAGRPGVVGLVIAGIVAAVMLWTQPSHAHKPITSKYTYNEDVFPIFRDRCGRCHVADGIAPMSLLNYNEAYPWAESLRGELIAEQMPAWHQNFAALSPREIDVIMVWASGGNPQGNAANRPPAMTVKNEWTLGSPDLALPLPAEFQFAADKLEDTQDFEVPTGIAQERWIRAIDLLPGTPAIVREAVIYLKPNSAKGRAPRGTPSPNMTEATPGLELARWMAGQDPQPLANGAGHLPARAELVVRVRYKKTWKYEGTAMTDRSTVGLYFTDRSKTTSSR